MLDAHRRRSRSISSEQPTLGIGEPKTLGTEARAKGTVFSLKVLERLGLMATQPAGDEQDEKVKRRGVHRVADHTRPRSRENRLKLAALDFWNTTGTGRLGSSPSAWRKGAPTARDAGPTTVTRAERRTGGRRVRLKLLNEVDRLSHTGELVTAFGLRRRLIPEGRYDSLHSRSRNATHSATETSFVSSARANVAETWFDTRRSQ